MLLQGLKLMLALRKVKCTGMETCFISQHGSRSWGSGEHTRITGGKILSGE